MPQRRTLPKKPEPVDHVTRSSAQNTPNKMTARYCFIYKIDKI